MKISLIIPTYNRIEITDVFIYQLVKYHQDDLHEIIISDDGSEQDQVKVIEKYKSEIKIPCKAVRQRNKGFRSARARNNGARISTGDYLCFLDQDCIPSIDYFKHTKRFARSNRFIITRPIYTKKDEKEKICDDSAVEYLVKLYEEHKKHLYKLVVKDYIYHIGKHLGIGDMRPKLQAGGFSLFKDKFQSVNGFDDNYIGWGHPDDDLGRRLYLMKIFGFNISHRAWMYHLWHPPEPSKGKGFNKEYYKRKIYDLEHVTAHIGVNDDTGEEIEVIKINEVNR
ncbi:glycosyltransferase [bacterium]|nr:glycosyltransferase [bacterium]